VNPAFFKLLYLRFWTFKTLIGLIEFVHDEKDLREGLGGWAFRCRLAMDSGSCLGVKR
jgi:hypothetical protein